MHASTVQGHTTTFLYRHAGARAETDLPRPPDERSHACNVTLVSQHSHAPCIAGKGYGCVDATNVWVRNCRGFFQCDGGKLPSLIFACGFPPGKPTYRCRCDGRQEEAGELLSAQTPTHAIPLGSCSLSRMLAVDQLTYMDAPLAEMPRRHSLNSSRTCTLRHNYVIGEGSPKAEQLRRVQEHWLERPRRLGLPEDPNCTFSPLYDHTSAELLPPGARVLVLGNSHTNQLIQSMLCRFHAEVQHVALRHPECDQCPFRYMNTQPAFETRSNCTIKVSSNASIRNKRPTEQLQRIQFHNGAQLTLLYNSPLFYIDNENIPGTIRRLLGVHTLAEFSVIVFHHLNGDWWAQKWAGYDHQCGSTIARRFGGPPSALTFAAQLQASSFRGTLLVDTAGLSDQYHVASADILCAAGEHFSRLAHIKTLCWDFLRRYMVDHRTKWACALDDVYHQCIPGPIDAVTDIWLAILWRVAESDDHRSKRKPKRGDRGR